MNVTQKMNKLNVMQLEDRQQLGMVAAKAVAKKIKEVQKEKEKINMLFAAAPSQNEFLEYLISVPGIKWHRINAFHMDEYIGLDPAATQGFYNFLDRAIFSKVPLKTVNRINVSGNDPIQECVRYSAILKSHPIDIACIGIGENGHLAFNDPHVADFNDSKWVKVVELDEKCRIQQINDGCFDALDKVPKTAVTLTIPVIISARHIACMVPGETKAQAVKDTLYQEIDEMYPATILRNHEAATIYIDVDSAKLLHAV